MCIWNDSKTFLLILFCWLRKFFCIHRLLSTFLLLLRLFVLVASNSIFNGVFFVVVQMKYYATRSFVAHSHSSLLFVTRLNNAFVYLFICEFAISVYFLTSFPILFQFAGDSLHSIHYFCRVRLLCVFDQPAK